MQEPRPFLRRLTPAVTGTVVAIAVAAGGGLAWLTNRIDPPGEPPAPEAPTALQPSPGDVPTAPGSPGGAVTPDRANPANPAPVAVERQVNIYGVKDTGTDIAIAPKLITLSAPDRPDAILRAAFNQLLDAPNDANFTSTIPAGTRLLDLQVKDDGIHVDLSAEFTSGGGSASMIGRLQQAIYTATTLDPTAPVWLSVAGKPMEVLGGEGVSVAQPMTRPEANDEQF